MFVRLKNGTFSKKKFLVTCLVIMTVSDNMTLKTNSYLIHTCIFELCKKVTIDFIYTTYIFYSMHPYIIDIIT